jgi:predicted membrane protein
MKNKNWFWGFFFLLSAIFIIASQTGSFGKIGVMGILATVFLLALVIQGLIIRNFFETFIPLSFLYMIYYKPLKFMYISPWLLILSAVLIAIAFSLFFRGETRWVKFSYDGARSFRQDKENIDNNNPYAKVTISTSCIYLHSEDLRSGHFISNIGKLEVYFDQVELSPGGAKVFLDCNVGTIKLYVPSHWRVEDNLNSILGEITNHLQEARPSEDAPKLTLVGNVIVGNVEIYYI